MMDGDKPYLLPFNYGYADNNIYIHSATEGKKLDLLQKNNKVCFEVEYTESMFKYDSACRWASAYQSVMGYGEVEVVTDFDQKVAGLDVIMKHNGFEGKATYGPEKVNAMVILKLKIDSLSGKQSGNWNKLFSSSQNTIETERLIVNEVTMEDLEKLHELHKIPEVDRYNTKGIPASLEETRNNLKPAVDNRLLQERTFIMWTINQKQTGEFMGEAGMWLSTDRFKLGEIFYNLAPDFWNKGYATETARALINFGFEKMKLHKIEAGAASGNLQSMRVMEKVGMNYEGLRRKILPIRGEWVDGVQYAIVEDDERK